MVVNCILIDVFGTPSTISLKNIEEIYKKCKYRKTKDFEKRYTWEYKDAEKNISYISLYAKDVGIEKKINKFELPPPVDNEFYYGYMCVILSENNIPTNDNLLNLDIAKWEDIYAYLMGGFEDLDDDETESDDDIPDELKTKEGGYMKNDFVVSDADSIEYESNKSNDSDEEGETDEEETTSDDSYIPSDNSELTEDEYIEN